MKHAQIWEAVRTHYYSKDYDSKIGKNANVLADEMMQVLQSFLDNMPTHEVPKADEFVTIGGVKYKLEEIKK